MKILIVRAEEILEKAEGFVAWAERSTSLKLMAVNKQHGDTMITLDATMTMPNPRPTRRKQTIINGN